MKPSFITTLHFKKGICMAALFAAALPFTSAFSNNKLKPATETDTLLLKNGYGVPDERGISIEDNGTAYWSNKDNTAMVYATLNATGNLKISLLAKSPDGAGTLSILIDGHSFTVNVPKSSEFQSISAGEVAITSAGIKPFTIKGIAKAGRFFPEVSGIVISGEAATGAYYNKTRYRTTPAVHMSYKIPKGDTASWFYNEVKVPEGSDVVNTFFMANGFNGGYFGIQRNSATERRIIFSVWSDYNTNDPKQIPSKYAVLLKQKGSLVSQEENFGNEGSGRHSIALYQWHTDSIYKFLVHSVPDTGGVTYTGFIFLNNKWNLIAKYYKPVGVRNMTQLYSFIEDFGGGTNSYKGRTMLVQNQWMVSPQGVWKQLTNAAFTNTAHDGAYSRNDYGAQVTGSGYTYFTGGFVPNTAHDKQPFSCNPGAQPNVTLPE